MKIKCWGYNNMGQLTDDALTPTNKSVPTDISAATMATNYLTYDPAHPHAPVSLSNGDTFPYDANGNMITRNENGLTYTQEFDAENRLVKVTATGNQITRFSYDGDGTLVKRVDPDGSSISYFLGMFEVRKDASGTETGTTTYYPAGGAMRVTTVLGRFISAETVTPRPPFGS
jgi:YD repeat-containing protein